MESYSKTMKISEKILNGINVKSIDILLYNGL